MKTHVAVAGVAFGVLTAAAAAQVSPVGPFAGPTTESFETQSALPDTPYQCLPDGIFAGAATLCDPAFSSIVLPNFWSLFCIASPRTGTRYAVSIGGPVEITFSSPVHRFGGYFATVGGADGAEVSFLDANGVVVGTAEMTTDQCDYTWSGWQSAQPFTKVRIVGNSPFGDGGYVHMDDLEYQAAAGCYANCDGSTAPPVLNVNDFICFQGRFAAGDPAANCDGSTAQPVLNVNDFICFQAAYAAGCP
jgi:hypothetical protein